MHQLDVVTERLARLERQNLSLRRAAAATLLAAAGVLLMAHAPAVPEVRARRLVLTDEAGTTRAALSTGPDGGVVLVLSDADRRPRASLGVSGPGTPSLTLHDGAGRSRVVLGMDAADGVYLRLSGPTDVLPGIALAVPAAGPRVLALVDPEGRPRLLAAVAQEEATLALKDRRTDAGVMLVAAADASRLAVSDARGIDRLWAAVRKESPVLQFFNTQRAATSGLATFNEDTGVAVMSGSTGPSQPGLALFGKKPGVLWSAPN